MNAIPNSALPHERTVEEEIANTLSLLHHPGDVWEIRALRTRQGTGSGYYSDPQQCARDIVAQMDGKVEAVYVTLNPVKSDIRARANARLQGHARATTNDVEITRRRWLPLDADPSRPSAISSTDSEHNAALNKARAIRAYLDPQGWPEPIFADSGNGGHLLYAIDLPNDDEARRLVERILKGLAARFDDAATEFPCIKLDTTVGNAARIIKLYGTLTRKGDVLPERPHRRSHILEAPDSIGVVSEQQLRALADALAPVGATGASPDSRAKSWPRGERWIMDAEQYLNAHGVKVRRTKPDAQGTTWELDECPWNREHQGSAWVRQFVGTGTITGGCHHNSCQGRKFADMRDVWEAGWRQSPPTITKGQHPPADTGAARAWDDPTPLSELLPTVAPFDMDMLPAKIRGFVWDIAERQQVPPDYPAVAAVVSLGATVGRCIGIRPKKADDWTVPPNLWGAVVGRSGLGKTPSMTAAMKPIERLIAEARTDHESALATYAAEKISYEIEKATLTDRIRAAARAAGRATKPTDESEAVPTESIEELKQQLAVLRPPQEPTARRYRTNDTTIEKLAELLIANPSGLLVHRDELMGWLRTLEKQGHEGDRAFYTEAWGGHPPITK